MMDFSEDFAFLERDLYTDFSGLTEDRSFRKVAMLEREIQRLVKSDPAKFKSTSVGSSLSWGYLYSIKPQKFESIAKAEVQKLQEVPELIWKSINSLAVIAPSKVPSSVVKEINLRKQEVALIASTIDAILKQADFEKRGLTEQEFDQIQIEIKNLRAAESSFTKGIDPQIIRLSQAVSKSSLLHDRFNSGYRDFTNPFDAWSQTLLNTGSGFFDFFRGGKGLPQIVQQTMLGFSSLYRYRFGSLVSDTKSGKLGKRADIQRLIKSSRFRIPPSLTGNRLVSALSKFSSSAVNTISKFAGPFGMALIALAKVVQYIIDKRQEQIAFNNNILQSTGLINQIGSLDPKIPDTDAQVTAFYQTIYDYFNDHSSTTTVTTPGGDVFSQKSFAIELNINPEKYTDLLTGLIQAGITFRDIESEFGTANIKPNSLANVRTDHIANFKGPLEDYYAIAKVYNIDPADLAKSLGNWKFSFGDLVGATNDALMNIYHISQSSFTQPQKFLQNVVELSDSFGYFTNRASALATSLASITQKRVLSADKARELLTGVIQELAGYSTSQIMGIIGPMLSENPAQVAKFFGKAESNLKLLFSDLDKQAKKASTSDERAAIETKKSLILRLLDKVRGYNLGVSADRHNLTEMASTVSMLFRIMPDMIEGVVDDALSTRLRTIFGHQAATKDPQVRDIVEFDQASTSLGLSQSAVDLAVGRRYARSQQSAPEPVPPEKLRQLILDAAINLSASTVTFSESLDTAIKPLGAKLQSTFQQIGSLVQDIVAWLTGAPIPTESPNAEVGAALPTAGPMEDYTSKVPASKVGGRMVKVRKILLHSTEGSLSSTISEFTESGRAASAHYVISRDGKTFQFVKESQVAYHGGAIGSKSPLTRQGFRAGSTINPYALGIELVHAKGDRGYTDEQYMQVARVAASMIQRYGLSVDDIISHEESARGRAEDHTGEYRSDPVDFDWGKFRSLVQANLTLYKIEAPDAPSSRANSDTTRSFKEQITQSQQLRRNLEQAYLSQKSIVEKHSYDSFSGKVDTIFSAYDPITLRAALSKNGKERAALFKSFAQVFKTTIDPNIIIPLISSYIQSQEARSREAQQQLIQLAREGVLGALQERFREMPSKTELKITRDQYTYLDKPFRKKFAHTIADIRQPWSAFIETYNIDVYVPASSRFQQLLTNTYRAGKGNTYRASKG